VLKRAIGVQQARRSNTYCGVCKGIYQAFYSPWEKLRIGIADDEICPDGLVHT